MFTRGQVAQDGSCSSSAFWAAHSPRQSYFVCVFIATHSRIRVIRFHRRNSQHTAHRLTTTMVGEVRASGGVLQPLLKMLSGKRKLSRGLRHVDSFIITKQRLGSTNGDSAASSSMQSAHTSTGEEGSDGGWATPTYCRQDSVELTKRRWSTDSRRLSMDGAAGAMS